MKKITLLFLSFTYFVGFAQDVTIPDNETFSCAYNQAQEELISNNSDYVQSSKAYEKNYRDKMQQFESNVKTLYTIPTVVHIIHDCAEIGTNANPTDAQVQAVVNEATQRFRHTHSNANTYSNLLYGVDTEIELCLANVDPDGNYTTGVIRHNDNVNNTGTYGTLGSVLNSMYKWDDSKYCNLFIVTSLDNASGVYMGAYDITIYNSSSFWSGLVAHEIGHYFSLKHTFQNESEPNCPENLDCLSSGDFVCDTPPKKSYGYVGGTCSAPANSCTTDDDDTSLNNPYRPVANGGLGDQVDMLANYMDYTGGCWDAFTLGQSNRMRFNIQNNRSTQLTHATIACGTPSVPANEVGLVNVDLNQTPCSSTYNPLVTIINNGNTTLNSLDIVVILDGVSSSLNWTGSLSSGNSATISMPTLIISNTGIFTADVSVSNPNGVTDSFADNNTYCLSVVNSGSGEDLPIDENFDANCAFPENFTVESSSSYGWAVANYNSTSSCLNCTSRYVAYSQTFVEKSICLPQLDLTGYSQPILKFSYGYIPRYNFISNTLRVNVSQNCGAYSTLWTKSDLDLATNTPPAYIDPGVLPSCEEIEEIEVDLAAYSNQSQVEICLQTDGRWYSTLILDNIEVIDNALLPVEFLEFEGKRINYSQIDLIWSTKSELNSLKFEIERSTDAINFKNIGELASLNNTSITSDYKFIDKNAPKFLCYYRLKQIDLDGSFEYSSVIKVDAEQENSIRIYPNPTNGKLWLAGEEVEEFKINILNIAGKRVHNFSKNGNSIDISDLPRGIYIVNITTENNSHIEKIVRE